jgi:flavorubredoxin
VTELVDLGPNPLPRELDHGVWWLGACLDAPHAGEILHGYNSCFLLCGENASMIIETGHPQDLPAIERQLDTVLARDDAPPVRWVFVTHAETPHSSGLGLFLEKYPEAVACGDMRDYHLYFPHFVDRFRTFVVGDEVDLGGTSLRFVEAVIRDLPATLWGLDTARRVLFPGDGFAYSHYHQAGQCGKTAEEVPGLPFDEMAGLFAELALYWTRFTDIEPYLERLDRLLYEELDVRLIAPTHGLPVTDLQRTVPLIYDGLRACRQTDHTPGAPHAS